MGVARLSFLASRTGDVALACFTAVLLVSVAADGDPLRKCRGKVDLDACRNLTEIISSKGYPVEERYVITEDGYVLTVFRIPFGRTGRGNQRRPVVFLQHGLLCSAADWVINLPHQSLGYILADAGYDVWMGNYRGTSYSSHISFSKERRRFWDFTIDDMIAFDLPAMLDYVLEVTRRKRLFYVGHSQGTMTLFGLLSERPEYNQKIKLFCALAPVTTIGYMTSPIRVFAPFGNTLGGVLRFFGRPYFVQNTKLMKFVARTTCRWKFSQRLCEIPLFVITGMEERGVNMTRLPVIMNHFPEGASTKNLAHYAQLIQSRRFQKYDYGWLKNLRLYGQRRPPEYDLTKVTAPVALFYALNDWFCNLKDVRQLHQKLPNVVLSYQVPDPRFTHLEFNLGVLARRQVYEPMLLFMRHFLNRAENGPIGPPSFDSVIEREDSARNLVDGAPEESPVVPLLGSSSPHDEND